MSELKLNKNGKIEFARFVFSMIVLLFHFGEKMLPKNFIIIDGLTFFRNGWFAVEFFFVLSGYLLAFSAYKMNNINISLGRETFNFMLKKVMSILPYHIIIFPITFIGICIFNEKTLIEIFIDLLKSVPNFLLIQRSGLLNKDVLGVEWYISVMLFSMLILFPLCRKFYDVFSKIISPVISVLIIGYLIETTGALNGTTVWSVFVSKTLLRGFAELCAGIFVFEFCRNLKKIKFSKMEKIILTLLEVFSYVFVIAFTTLDFSKKYSGTFLIFVCIAICLSFSDITYGTKIFENKITIFLGSLSLPIYLCHSLIRRVIFSNIFEFNVWGNFIVYLILTAIFVAISIPLEKFLRKKLQRYLGQKLSQI